jgi:putative tricarboxylic transport membrane protein
MQSRKWFFLLLLCVVSISFVFGEGQQDSAANYPEKEIRLIVAFAPGGQTDLIARKLADIVQKNGIMDKSVLVVNMPGGNTADAVNAVKNSRPDGYTFLIHHTNIITNNIMGNLSTKYDEMDLLGGIVEQPFGIVARSDDNRWKDAIEFIADAKANPGKYSVGFPGFASPGHFALLQFLGANDALGTVKEVPYSGGAATIAAHLGGHVDLRATNMGDSARFIESGEVKFLGMVSKNRNPNYPDIISLSDMGAPGDGMILRTGLFAPKGIPEEIKAKFVKIMQQAAGTPEFKEFSDGMSNTIVLSSGAEFKKAYDIDYAAIAILAKGLKK